MKRGVHKASKVNGQTLSMSGFLVMNSRGDLRLSRGIPALEPGEVSCALTLSVPLKLFSRPALKAEITLPDNVGAADASADIVLDLRRALRACPNVELKIAGQK